MNMLCPLARGQKREFSAEHSYELSCQLLRAKVGPPLAEELASVAARLTKEIRRMPKGAGVVPESIKCTYLYSEWLLAGTVKGGPDPEDYTIKKASIRGTIRVDFIQDGKDFFVEVEMPARLDRNKKLHWTTKIKIHALAETMCS